MNKKKMIKRLPFLLVMMCLHLFSIQVSAADASEGSGAEFGVSVVYPDNQVKSTGEQGYFDIRVKPGDKQELKIKVTNYSKNKITVSPQVNRGLTTETGSVSYEIPKKKDNYKLDEPNDFYKMATLNEKELNLKGEESKEVIVTLNIPKKEFTGMVLGGIHFTQKVKDDTSKQVVNTFAYSIPIVLTEGDKPAKKDFSFKKVYPTLRNYHPYIEAVLSNDTPNIINRLQVDAKILDAKTKETVYASKQDRLQMAPLSDFPFGFDLRDSAFSPGKYELQMKIEADGEKREFNEAFEITKKDADELNEDSVIEKPEMNPWIKYAIIAGIVLLVLIIIGVIIHFIRKKKKNNKKSSSKKSKSNKKGKSSKKTSSSHSKKKSSSKNKKSKNKK